MSVWVLKNQLNYRKTTNWVASIAGLFFIIVIGQFDARDENFGYLYIFFSGMIGICAMILPGLSGALILVLLGVYEFVLRALIGFELDYIMIFALGCLGGLIFFSRGLAFLLTHFKNLTYSVIIGMMLGSVYVLWPWQIIVGVDIDGDISQHMVQGIRMFPHSYADRSGTSAMMPQIFSAMSLGMVIVFFLNKISDER